MEVMMGAPNVKQASMARLSAGRDTSLVGGQDSYFAVIPGMAPECRASSPAVIPMSELRFGQLASPSRPRPLVTLPVRFRPPDGPISSQRHWLTQLCGPYRTSALFAYCGGAPN